MMKFCLLIILLAFDKAFSFEYRNLSLSEIKDFFSSSEYIVLEFYKDNCQQSELINKLLVQVSGLLSPNFDIKFGRINLTENDNDILHKFDVSSIPSIKLFSVEDDRNFEYFGEMKKESILKFIVNHLTKLIPKIETPSQLEDLLDKKMVCLVVCGKIELYKKRIEKIKDILNDKENIELYHVETEKIQKILECSSDFDLVMIKPFDEKVLRFSQNFTSDKIEEWIDTYSLPLLAELNDQNFQGSLQTLYPLIILVTNNENDPMFLKIKKILYQEALTYRNRAIFLYSNNNTLLAKKVLGFNKIEKLPIIVGLVSGNEDSFSKYFYDYATFTEKNINEWISDLTTSKFISKADNLKKNVKSEDIPDNIHDGYIKIVVGKTFENSILNNQKDVLLELISPWEGECNKLDVKFKLIAEKFKNNSNLIVARMDAIKNEYNDLHLNSLPYVLLFRGGNQTIEEKFNKRIKFEGEFSVSSIISFVKNNSFHPTNDVQILKNEHIIEQEELLIKLKELIENDNKKEIEKEGIDDKLNLYDINKLLSNNETLEDIELTEEDLADDDEDEEEKEYEKRRVIREANMARLGEL